MAFTLSEAGMATLDNLSVGTYYATVTDEVGCERLRPKLQLLLDRTRLSVFLDRTERAENLLRGSE